VGGIIALSLVFLVKHRATKDVALRHDLVAVSTSDFEEFGGFLGTGDDIMEDTMTVREARDRCASMPDCAGFTFKGHRLDDDRGVIIFKNQWHFGKCSDWTSFRKADHRLADYVFEYHAGYLGTGDDIDHGEMNVLEAKQHCAQLPSCVGFSFEGVRGDMDRGDVFFKNDWNFGQSDSWSSFKKAPLVDFQEFEGFLGEGDDIENAIMTLAQAKHHCEGLAACVGFTFEGQRGDNDEGMVYFKDDWAIGESDSWTSFKKVPAQRSPPAIEKASEEPSPAGFGAKEPSVPDQHLPSIPYSKPPCGIGLAELKVVGSKAEGVKGGAICAPACGTIREQNHCPASHMTGDVDVQCAYNEDDRMYCTLECEWDEDCPHGTFCAIVQYPMGICVFH
jgi:hypothetical protein